MLAGVAAILCPLLTIQTLAQIMPHPTLAPDADGPQAVAFFQEWYGVQQAQTLFHILGIIWFGVFVLCLHTMLRPMEPAPAFWSRLMLWSSNGIVAVKVAVMAMVSGAISLVKAPGLEIDGMMVLAIYHAGWYAHVLVVYLLPFFWAGFAACVLKTNVLPRWTAWTAIGGLVAALVGIVSVVTPIAWIPYPVFALLMLWSLIMGVYLVATARNAPHADSVPAPS